MVRQMVIGLGTGRQVSVAPRFYSDGADATIAWGRDLGSRLPPGTVVGLVGELGAGKTVLAGALLHGAGLDEEVLVTSPTFTLMNRYPGAVPYVHVDLYRIEDAADAFDAGIEEAMLSPGDGLVVVEWFERFPQLWPEHHLRIELTVASRTGRWLSAGGADG
jgi:tRNA threonylcarbamoyladenosine biosynthesis protein TsaE